MGNMPARLSDLRKTAKKVTIHDVARDDNGDVIVDPGGSPVRADIEVWVVKLNDVDYDKATTAADAAKARAMIGRNDHDSDEWLAHYGSALEMGDDPDRLIEFLAAWHIGEQGPLIEARLALDEEGEWGKDNYLQGLFDAWLGSDDQPGLDVIYVQKDDDPDTLDADAVTQLEQAIKVHDEIARYQAQVEERRAYEKERFAREHESSSLDSLRVSVTEKYLQVQAEEVWYAAYQRHRTYLSTRRLDNRSKRYFESFAEFLDTDASVRQELLDAYESFAVEGAAGKESPVPQSSSPQSGSPGEEGTSPSSGPQDANDSRTSPTSS